MIEVKEDGYYLFALAADKGSKLYVDNKLLITWDGSYTRTDYTSIVPLTKGFYPVRIEHNQKNPDFKLKFSYLTPANTAAKNITPIPFELQYRKK